jgi:cell division protease FtsH
MFDDLAVFLGGRVAEEIFCADITTGASNDLERATKMAKQMVTRYGMTEALGTQVYGEANHEVFLGRDYGATPDYSEATAQRIDEEVAKIMAKAHDRAYAVLKNNAEQIELMVSILIERETVEGEALEALLNNTWNDYIEHEDEILARKASELKKQEEEDERRRQEKQREAEEAAKNGQQGIAPPGGFGNTPDAPPPNAATRYTLEDIFSGKVTPEQLFEAQRRAIKRNQQEQEDDPNQKEDDESRKD